MGLYLHTPLTTSNNINFYSHVVSLRTVAKNMDCGCDIAEEISWATSYILAHTYSNGRLLDEVVNFTYGEMIFAEI